jgi:hypothetical protein
MFDLEGSTSLLSILWQWSPWRGISRCLNGNGILSYTRHPLSAPRRRLPLPLDQFSVNVQLTKLMPFFGIIQHEGCAKGIELVLGRA